MDKKEKIPKWYIRDYNKTNSRLNSIEDVINKLIEEIKSLKNWYHR